MLSGSGLWLEGGEGCGVGFEGGVHVRRGDRNGGHATAEA